MDKRIAVPVNNNDLLDTHFGHCRFFKIFTIKENQIVEEIKLIPPPHEPGVLPTWIAEQGATDVIAGGMGRKAIQIFNTNKVNVFVGAEQKPANELINSFISGDLNLSANYCNH